MKQIVFSPVFRGILAGAVIAMAAAGCGTGSVPRDLMMEEAGSGAVERPVAMKGESTFLEGQLASLVTVSRGFDRGRGSRGAGKQGIRRNLKKDEGAFGETGTIYGDSEEDQKNAMEEYVRIAKARRAAGSPMPPVTLRVEFLNKGTEPVVIEVTELNSSLGNFAARPEKLTVAPGETGSLDPMISQLGVTSDEIPLKLAVRVGDKRDAQVVVVKNVISDSLKKEFEKRR
jgi:hypothetical protein